MKRSPASMSWRARARPNGLTEAEKAEQQALRQEYVADVKASLRAQIEQHLHPGAGRHHPQDWSEKELKMERRVCARICSQTLCYARRIVLYYTCTVMTA